MEYVYLLNTEAVRDAGSEMRSAAEIISSAVSNLNDILYHQKIFMTDWLDRLEAILNKEKQSGK